MGDAGVGFDSWLSEYKHVCRPRLRPWDAVTFDYECPPAILSACIGVYLLVNVHQRSLEEMSETAPSTVSGHRLSCGVFHLEWMVVELVVGNVISDLSANIAVCTYVMMKICSKTTGLDSRNIHRDCSSHIREHLASPEELPEELMGLDDANNNDEALECVCCQ